MCGGIERLHVLYTGITNLIVYVNYCCVWLIIAIDPPNLNCCTQKDAMAIETCQSNHGLQSEYYQPVIDTLLQ